MVPFAFLTARTSREDILEGLRAGADDYLVKPFDVEILRSKVQVLLRLRRLQTELASSERLRLLGQTVVALNHEINNPLMGLLCSLEMLGLEPELPPSIKTRLEGITEMTLRIQNVIRKLSGLQEVRTRDYVPGVSMLDLS
jgi:response regulator RpfG family c-di-GMP phosphodiesterase